MSFGSRRATRLLDREALWSYAVRALGGRALTTAELRDRLRRRAAEAGDVDPVIEKLREYGYLSDKQFAEGFATARRDNQGFGQARVLRDLRQRKVAAPLAETAVRDAFAGVDEVASIEQYLERKYRSRNLTTFLRDEKNLAATFRRLRYAGFSAGNAIRVLKKYAARADELEDEPPAEE